MKLRRIKIRNFRGAQDVELGGLSGLNILVGRNNSGKSTVLSAVGGFFEHFREGGIVRLPRVGEAPQGAVGPGSFMRDIDYFAKDLSHPIEIEARFALADPEIDALLGNIVAEAPQLENAARAAVVAGSTLLVRLQSNPPPAPFTFVQQLSIEGSDGAQGISLLQIPASDAFAIAGSLSGLRDLRSYANSVQTTASRMDSSEFERAKRERGMSYYVAGLDPAARRAITEQILRADTYDQFIEGLREAAMSLPRFPGHLDCGDSVAQGGVRDGNEVPTRVPTPRCGVGAAA